jgi:hypothetical protein
MNKPVLSKAAARAGVLLSGVCLAANALAASTPLLDFSFNEGTGTNVTDSASKLVGTLGIVPDDTINPVVVAGSPAGTASDKAVSLNVGNSTGQGFLFVDDSDSPIMSTLATNAFTIETWVKIDPSDVREYEGLGGYGSSIKLGLHNGYILFTLLGIVDIESTLYVGADDTWHHVAVAWQPGVGATFFLDGGNETSMADTNSPRAFSNNYLVIGAETVGGNTAQASYDRFRIHKAVLTASQLDSVAATPKAALSSTLVAFNFNESAAPFASSATTVRKAVPSNDYLVSTKKPTFVTDTPSAKSGDYALNFASGNQVIVADPNTTLALDQSDSSFTIQAWIKLGVQPSANTKSVFFFNNGPGGALSFAIRKDMHVVMTTLGVLDVESAAIVPNDGGWHHVAVVHENGKEMRFYVDGSLQDTYAYTGGVIFSRTETSFMFGSESGGNPFVGSIDRFKLAKGKLTVDELDWWPVPGVQPGSPTLTIQNSVKLTWPTMPGGYSLQSSTDLGDTKNWTTVTNTPLVGSEGYFMVFPSTSAKVFYRLYKP